MDSLLLFALMIGLITGLYYSFMALGLNVIFGVMKIINIAHGDVLMLGAFAGYLFFQIFHIAPLVSVIISIPLFFALGCALYVVFVPRVLRLYDPEMGSFLIFFGLSVIIEYTAAILFGTQTYALREPLLSALNIDTLGFSLPLNYFIVAAISVTFIVLTFYLLKFTKFGISTRAVMFDSNLAACYGVNPNRVSFLAFAYSLGLTGVAGVLSPYVTATIQSQEGFFLTIIAFSILIIGSLGNPLGTMVGGLAYGVITSVSAIYIPEWSFTLLFAILVVIIIFRPNGLLGGRTRDV